MTAFRLGLVFWLSCAELGLGHETSNSAPGSRYGCTARDGDLLL